MICLITSTAYEAAYLLKKVQVMETTKEGPIILYLCEYQGTQFLLLLTGYGKLNVGLGIGYAIRSYEITTFLGFGDCATVVGTPESIGKVVILTTSLETDVNFVPLGYPQSVIPGMDRATYVSNQRLVSCAEEVCKKEGITYGIGNIGSTEGFIANLGMAERMARSHSIDYIDNESGPIGQAASSLGIPFILIKGVSNYADGNAVSDYESYKKVADMLSCQIIYRLLIKLLLED